MIDPRFYTSMPPLALGDLIAGLDVETLDGKFLDEVITAPAALAGSAAGDISFFYNKRFASQLDAANATACFVPEKLASKLGEAKIIALVSNAPRAHFARVCERLVKVGVKAPKSNQIAKSANVHPSAVIGQGVTIGEETQIGAFAYIGDGVQIGPRCTISPHAVIEFTYMGADCRVQPGAVIGGFGFGVAKDEKGLIDIPHLGRVIMGDRISIGAQSCVDRGQLGDTVLKDDVKLDNMVQIAHNVTVGAGTVMAAHVGISGSCTIGAGCQFGGRVGLADHITIGDGVSLAANAGVMHNVPAGEVWSGIPAMPIRDHMRMVSAMRKLSTPKTKGG